MTVTTVPTLARLSEAEVNIYREEGYLVVREVFSRAEMAMISMEAERLLTRTELIHTGNLRCRWQPHCTTGECLFETFDPFIDLAPLCASLARDPRLLERVGDLYGETAFLFKDKLIFKPPGAKGHQLHQDYIGWASFPRSFMTAAVAVDPCDATNGATEVFPRHHLRGYLSPEDGDYHPLAEEAIDLNSGLVLDLQPGDVAFFGCFTPHRSAPNESNQWRRLLYLSYNAASDGGDQREAHYAEFHTWLRKKYAEYGKTEVYFQ